MKKVAVIGAGVFGLEISIQLAKSGYAVELFEIEDEILRGSTSNSILRLHRGLHYPRDLATAEQSRIGYEQFLSRFPESINFRFTNYYAVAKEGSKVTGEDFESFAKRAKIEVNSPVLPTESGVLWSYQSVVDINANKVKAKNDVNNLSLVISSLNAETSIFFRIYSIIDGKYFLGEIQSFKTMLLPITTNIVYKLL